MSHRHIYLFTTDISEVYDDHKVMSEQHSNKLISNRSMSNFFVMIFGIQLKNDAFSITQINQIAQLNIK